MSTFVERFNNTLARRETKGQDALLAEFKSDQVRRAANGPRYINWGTPQWSSADWDLDRLVKDGYERVIWVWRGVDAIAQHAANLTIRAVKGDVENPFERTFVDDPILRNLNLASWPGTGPKDAPVEMAWQFRYRLSSLLLLSKVGVYVEVVRKRGGGIFSLSLVHPGHCRPIPDIDKLVGAFRVDMPDGGYTDLPPFNPSGNDAHSILWIRKPHPTDPLSATTPLQAAGISIDLDFWARLYNRTFMQNDGRPGGLLAIKGGMQDDDITELRARFGGGPSQAGRTTVVEAEAVSWVDTAMSPRDAQYVQSRTITKEEILMALGVSETVIGNAAGKTFDNADNEREVFWEFTMLPHIGILDRAFESLTEGGIDDEVRLWHDTSGIDALQRVQRRKAAEARVDVQLGLKSIDEFRGVDGVKPLDLPETKVLWVPAAGRGAVGDKADVEAANKIHIIAPPPGAGGTGSTKPGATVPGQSREIPTLRRTLSEISGKDDDTEPEVKAIEWAGWATWPAIEAKALDTPGVTSHSTMVAADVSVPASVEDAVMLAAAEFGMQPLDTSEWHVTLAFMGEPTDDDLETIDEVVDDTLPSTLLAGSLGSPAVFGERGGPRAVVMLVDVPGLAEYRTDLVRALDEADVPQQSEHGFTAHMTVGYVEPDVDPDSLAGLLTTLMSEAGQAISLPSIGLYVGSKRYEGPGEPDPFGSAGETGATEGKAFDPSQPRDPETGQWVTLYHLTSSAKFRLNPRKVPADNALAITQRTDPGLFLTGSPEGWINGHGYVRPFVAEVRVPAASLRRERWGDEQFLPADQFDQAEVTRVIPTDAYARERYGDHGWIEESAGTEFDTGKPIPSRSGNVAPFPDYRYPGPDARDMSPEQVAEHRRRARAATRDRRMTKAFDPAQPRDPRTGEWVAGSVGFHGTRYTFKPGDILEGGHSSNQGSGVPGQHVYFTRQRDIAQEFAEYAYGPEGHYDAPPKVYEVEPIDDVEPDPDEDPEVESFRSRRVRVVRQVKAEQPATKHAVHGWLVHGGGVATVVRGETTFTKAFDPHQPRDPHTGRWLRTGGAALLEHPTTSGTSRTWGDVQAQVRAEHPDLAARLDAANGWDRPARQDARSGWDWTQTATPLTSLEDGYGGFGSEEGLRAAFETDLPGGFRSVVRDTTDPKYRGHGSAIEVNGKIVNARGEDVGYFERTLYPATGIVSHDSLAIAVSHRGKGLGAALVKHSTAAVEKAGYRKINVYAAGPGFVDDAKRPLTLSGWRMWARPDLGFRFDDAGREKVVEYLHAQIHPADSPESDLQRRFVTADRTKWPTPAEVYAVAPEALADGWSGERPLAAATKSYLDDGMLHLECIPGANPDRHGSRVGATDSEGKAFDPNELRDEHGRWTRGAHSLVASIAPSVRDGVLAHQAAAPTPATRRYRVSTIERPAPAPGTHTAVFDVDETLIHAAPLRAQRNAGVLTRQQQHAQALDTTTPPVGEIVDAMRRAKEQGLAVVVATARPPEDRGALGVYFRHVGVPVDALFTRPDTNFDVEDDVVKRAMVGRMRALGWDPVVSFDDKPGNVAMFHDEGVPAVLVRSADKPAAPAARTWVRSTNEFGQRISVMDTEHGRYVIDGNGIPSMRWSVTYPDGDYALGKTKREVLGEAEIDLAQRDREYRANNREGKSARRSIPNQAARTKLMDGLAAQDAEDLRIAEADVYAAIMDALERQERTVIARLTGTKARRHTRHWDPPGEAKIDPRYVLDLARWRRELDAAVRPALQRAAAAGAQSVARRLGLGVTAGLPEADMVVQSGVQRIVTGLLKRFLEVQDVIAQGEASGLPMDGIEQAVRDAYKAKAAWAKRASSDETVGAYNAGSMERAQRSGKVFRKMWLSSRDEKVRATHRAADGQVVPVDGNFIVGGWPLQYPGDPTGPPREVFNCRCTLLYEARKV